MSSGLRWITRESAEAGTSSGAEEKPPQPESEAARAAASARKQRSNLVLIDVGLLFDVRFPGPLKVLGVGLLVPPQGPPLSLLLDDVRLVPQQLPDHSGDIGFVGLRHG